MKSGDVIAMTGDSRLAYHAVPCIVKDRNDDEPPHCLEWEEHANGDNMPLIKQPKKECDKAVDSCPICRKYYNPSMTREILGSFSKNAEEWSPFASYLATTRININVRQVHAPDEVVKLDLTLK